MRAPPKHQRHILSTDIRVGRAEEKLDENNKIAACQDKKEIHGFKKGSADLLTWI